MPNKNVKKTKQPECNDKTDAIPKVSTRSKSQLNTPIKSQSIASCNSYSKMYILNQRLNCNNQQAMME